MLKWGWDTKKTELVNLTRFGCIRPTRVKICTHFCLFLNKTILARNEKIMVVHCNRHCPVFSKCHHLSQRTVEHFTLPSQHSLLKAGNWDRSGCRERSVTPGPMFVKMPTIVGILTFIIMINTTSDRLKAIHFFIYEID